MLNADSLRGRGRSQPPLQLCLKLQAPLHLSLELGLKVGNLVLSLCQALGQLQAGQTPQSQTWPCCNDSHIKKEQPACMWTVSSSLAKVSRRYEVFAFDCTCTGRGQPA